MNPIDSNEQLDDNLVDKNTEQYIKLQSIAKETQSNLQSLLSRYCHRSSSNANTDTVQSSTASILDKFDRLIASVNELQHSSEKRECSENLSDALEKIKLQWHSTHCQSKNVISMMESRVQDAKLDLITAMNNNNQLFCEFVQKAGAECSHASTTMQEIVRSTAEDCYRKKEQLIQGTEAELAEVLHTYHEVKRCLLDDRQSTRGLQSIAMIEFYAQHHHDAAKLHRHLNQQVIDLFLQLQQEKIECLLARNELKYNCRVMEEKKYENKQALLLQHHRCTAAANLAILKGEYARQRDAAEAERDELARDAHKCLSGMQELHAKARRFAKSHAIEISKLRNIKIDSFRELRERLDRAVERISTFGGDTAAQCIESLLRTYLMQLTMDVKRFECCCISHASCVDDDGQDAAAIGTNCRDERSDLISARWPPIL